MKQSDNKRLCPSVDEHNANKRVAPSHGERSPSRNNRKAWLIRWGVVDTLPSRSLTNAVLRREQATSAWNALQTRANKRPDRRRSPNSQLDSYLLLSHIDQNAMGDGEISLLIFSYTILYSTDQHMLVPQ